MHTYIYFNERFLFLKIFFSKIKNLEDIFSLNLLSNAVILSVKILGHEGADVKASVIH